MTYIIPSVISISSRCRRYLFWLNLLFYWHGLHQVAAVINCATSEQLPSEQTLQINSSSIKFKCKLFLDLSRTFLLQYSTRNYTIAQGTNGFKARLHRSFSRKENIGRAREYFHFWENLKLLNGTDLFCIIYSIIYDSLHLTGWGFGFFFLLVFIKEWVVI